MTLIPSAGFAQDRLQSADRTPPAAYAQIPQGSIVGWGSQVVGGDLSQGFVSLAARANHSLGLKSDGSIVAWGYNGSGQTNVPAPNTGFIAVAAGCCHSLGLKADGSIVAWGNNYYGQTNVPAPNANFIAAAAGSHHSLGLKADGSIVTWGYNYYGQTNVPAPNTGFVAVAAGGQHSLALKTDGSIVAWGDNYSGQTNVPAPNADFIAVAAGGHSLGLKADGSIVAWGCGGGWNYGQCNVPAPNSGFIAVAAGGHSLGLKADGSVVAWGCGNPDYDSGQCNDPAPNTGFVAIAAGGYHNLGLKADGSIVAWGCGGSGQTNVPAPNSGFVAVAVATGDTFGDHSPTPGHTLALKADGSIVAWGWNFSGQINVPAPNADFIGIAAGAWHSLGLKGDGSIVAWGNNWYGQRNVPAPNAGFVAVAASGWWTALAEPGGHSLGLKADGSIVAWGCDECYSGQCNVPVPNSSFVAIAAGAYHSLGLKADGAIVAWGANGYWGCCDQEGNVFWVEIGQCNVPEPNADFVGIAAGFYHSLGLKADGSIVAWGANWYRQCDVPAPNSGFVAVAAGTRHNLGLKADGSIVAWGQNNNGQCDVPAPNSGFVAVAVGGYHSVAIRGNVPTQVLTVAPGGAMDFGSIAVGATADRGFTLRNTGSNPIVGNASAPVPFSVVSGASYNLAPGQTQAVTVRYSPAQPGNHIAYITFTGTGTQQRQLLGSAFATPINGSVVGTVVEDDATAAATAGQPIPGALISIAGVRTISNQQGIFSLPGIVPGTYALTVTHPTGGYLTVNLPDVTIPAGPAPPVVVKLKRPIVPPPPIPGQRNTPVLLVSGFGCTDPPWDTAVPCDENYCKFTCDKSTWGNVRTALTASGFEFPNPDPVGHPEWDYIGELVWDPNEPTPGESYPLAGGILHGTEGVQWNVPRLKAYVKAKVKQFYEKQGYYPASIDIVASSMGGLITRAFLKDHRQLEVYPDTNQKLNLKVGKVIMIGTPNAGSALADAASDINAITESVLGTHFVCPAAALGSLHDLKTDVAQKFNSNYLWPEDVQLFLLGGTRRSPLDCPKLKAGDTFLTATPFGSPNDGAVPETSLLGTYTTRIPGNSAETTIAAFVLETRWAMHPSLYKKLPIDHLWLKQDTAGVAWVQCVLTNRYPESACGGATSSYGALAGAESAPATSMIENRGFVLAPGEGTQWVIPSDSATTLSLLLSAGDAMTSATVQDPDGNVVAPTEVNADPWTQTYDVAAPTTGEWTVSFSLDPAATASAGVSVFAAGDGPAALIPITEDSILNSQNALVSCALYYPGEEPDAVVPVTGATVFVDLALPDGTTTQLALLDDGLHSDGLADDGIYATVFTTTAQAGSYRLRYRADGTAGGLAFRRVALGTFGVSSAAARISGNLTDEPVDFDADGFADFLRVQFWVTAQQAGTYLASGLVVDETGGSSIAGSETALELPIGTSTVSVLFDCRKLTVPGTYGPFSLQNLELFERRDDRIAWVDRYREAYALATTQIEIPCPPFDGDCDGDRDLGDIAAFQRCFSPGVPAEAGCARFDQSGDEGVDLSDFAGLRGALTGPMTPPVP